VSLTVAAISTLPAAMTCAAAFAMSLQPPENLATAGPLPPMLWFPVLVFVGLFSVCLKPGSIADYRSTGVDLAAAGLLATHFVAH
jgi:hypothetical protein